MEVRNSVFALGISLAEIVLSGVDGFHLFTNHDYRKPDADYLPKVEETIFKQRIRANFVQIHFKLNCFPHEMIS